MNEMRVPEPTLRRLPWYLAYLKMAAAQGETAISSTQIAQAISVSASQIAKDLSFIKISGKTRIGYDIHKLIEVLETFLGFGRVHQAYLFGAGNLGGALLHDKGLSQYGMEILAGFDVNPDLVGHEVNGIPVYHLDEYYERQRQQPASIGILTVPVQKAQETTDYIIRGGIRAIWNFTPFRISVPEHIVVQNTSIYAHLAVMFNRLECEMNP